MSRLYIALTVSMFMLPALLRAQADSTASSALGADFSLELKSRRMWRGFVSSKVPELTACIDLSYGGLFAGAWSAYSFAARPMQEVDLWLGYAHSGFKLTLIDYWYPSDTLGWRSDFFHFDARTTCHQVEAILQYDGTRVPISLLCGVMVYGDDRDAEGQNRYSSYFEAAYRFEHGGVGLRPFVGVSPTPNGMYSPGFNVVNLGLTLSKSLRVSSSWVMPASCSLVVNPHQETVNVVLTLGII
ncbi:MAG: hypothetical protein IJU72_01205 [Bacteroidales bacterium]|nr:hypothetical protein [Bacteroidales bacterium]